MSRAAIVTTRRLSTGSPERLVIGAGCALVAVYVSIVVVMMDRSTYDMWVTALIGPILVALTLPALAKQAARENNRRVFWFLLAALIVKLAVGTYIRYYNTVILNGGTDSNTYHEWGLDLFQNFRSGDFDTELPSLSGTDFIRFFTGIVYAVIGPSRPGGFLVFSWLAFLGLFFFYRAYVVAVPEGRRKSYARLLFFLPTHIFWPSSVGKEAFMMLALGIAALGTAHLLTKATLRGLMIGGLGLWMAALVRPHEAAIMFFGVGVAYVFRRSSAKWVMFGPIAKAAGISLLVIIGVLLAGRTEQFLHERDIRTDQGATGVLESLSDDPEGGSAFTPTLLTSPAKAPAALVTVLYRPFPHEAHTFRALISAIEGVFLLGLTVWRLPTIIRSFKTLRRQPYVAAALAYTSVFVVGFSGFNNFGNLVRQRALLFPLLLVLLTATAAKNSSKKASSASVRS